MPKDPVATEGSLQHVVSVILRTGVIAAALVAVVAESVFLLRHGAEKTSYGSFQPESEVQRTLTGIFGGLGKGDVRSWMMLAVLILVATPILRVIVSFFGFVKERDRTYAAITLLVLALLAIGLVAGATHG